MKGTFLILFLFCICQSGFAQPRMPITLKIIPGSRSNLSDSNAAKIDALVKSFVQARQGLLNQQYIPDSIPNAFTEKLPFPVYKGNNGKGFDLYESTMDNMPMLVPDKNNIADNDKMPGSMPNRLDNWYKVPEKPRSIPFNQYKMPPLAKPFPSW